MSFLFWRQIVRHFVIWNILKFIFNTILKRHKATNTVCIHFIIMTEAINDDILEDMLPLYYKRLFPFKPYYKWLSYGNVDKNYFPRREFSFTLRDDIYLRYQSFATIDQLKDEIMKQRPFKIDVGAVFNNKPKDHKTVTMLKPIEKELVFDVDMTDYDDVRHCCSGAKMCPQCWPLIVIAIKVIDAALRDDFGFNHRLWVYSGRRGVHCWVCDDGARKLTQAARSAVADYLSVIECGGEEAGKKVKLTGEINYPFMTRSLDIIRRHFEDLHIKNQDFLENEERWTKILALVTHNPTRTKLEENMERLKNSSNRWNCIEAQLSKSLPPSKGSVDRKQLQQHPLEEILLQLSYPRLDVNVTKGLNHLLKSPFCIHPKTGRVCVPIDVNNLDTFNPFTVPTITQLVNEINKHDAEIQMTVQNDDNGHKTKVKDYKKTSLCHSIEVFKEFVKALEKTLSGQRIAKSDLTGEF